MGYNLLKYLLALLFIFTSLNALDDKDKNLNLIAPTNLNRIEGNKGPLENIKKEERVSDFSSSKSPKISSLNKPIDVSKYKKVKLVDAVLETLAHSDLLKSSREKVIQYDLKLKNAIADFYPTIDAEYNYGRTRTEPGSLEGERFKFFKDKNYKLVLRQNLYSGGASLNNVKSVRKKLEVAENQYKITLDKEVKKAIKAYFGVVFSNRSVMVNERNMKKLKKILEIVTIKYDNGAASIGDLTSIKANVANAMTKLVKVNSKFVESLRYYEYIVGTNFEKTLPYEKNFDVSITDFDELYKRALENNRGLINYYKSIEDEKFSQRKARASFKPKIDFELSYKKTMDAEDLEVEEKDINGKIKLSYNIFNGGKDKNKVLEVNSKIRDLNYRLEEEKKKLKWNLSKVHTSVTSVLEALKSTITEVKASRKMVGAYWDAFKLGEQDLSSLLQGQRQLNTAETELVKYEESHITDFFNILELTGDLSSFFDVDPENPKFIDFTKSDYKKSIIAKDGDNLDIDLKSEQKKELEDFNKKDLVKKEEIKNIPLPKTSMNENINKYLEEFLKFDDESFMIEISSFGNIYDSFDFIKNNNLDTNSFSYDVVKKYNIETRVAHNNFKTISEAEEYLKALKSKKLDKKYEIKKVKDIKTLYNKYIDGLKIKVQKQKTKIKIVEKIRQAVKKEEFKTDEEFKNKFLNSKENDFTINLSSFTDIEKLEEFIKSNGIYKESFFFRYGDSGRLIKLVFGVYSNYASLESKLNSFILENDNIYPIVEKISLVKKQYKENIDLNIKKEEPITYEYINLSKNEAKKLSNKTEKNKKIKEVDKNDDLLILTKRPNIDDINKKEKEELKEIKKKIEEILPTKKDKIEKKLELKSEKKIIEESVNKKEEIKDGSFESKFLNTPENYYTTNLASFSDMELAKKFVKNNKIKDNTILVISNSGKILVTHGVYSTREKALTSISSLPEKIKENKPFIQKIIWTQKSYIKNNLKGNLSEKNKKDELEAKKLEEEKKLEELRLKKLEEEKAKKLEELKKAEEIRIEEEKAKKLAEQKRIEEEKAKKLEEEKKSKELRLKKLAEEKAKKQEELKKAEEIRIEEEKAKKLENKVKKLDNSFESKFLNASENYYTTNLASFSNIKLAKKFVKNNKIEDNTILVISNSGKILVTYGVYSTRKKALDAISSLPAKIKENKPFIQKIVWTQRSYKKNNLKENLSEKNKKDKLEEKRIEEEKKSEELRLKKLEEEKAKKLEDEKK
ncbi:MAG: hypothetical protein C0625_04465, partial [Arcobacter sp.]